MLTVSPHRLLGRYVGIFVENIWNTITPRQSLCELHQNLHARYPCTCMAYAWRADSFYDAGVDKRTISMCYCVDRKLIHELDFMSDWETTRFVLLMSRRFQHFRCMTLSKKTLVRGCAPDHNPSLDLDCMSDWVGFAAAALRRCTLVSVCVDAVYFNTDRCTRTLIR